MILNFALVALGGAIGSSARYGVILAGLRLFGPGFPAGVLAVNLIGSFLIGVFVVFAAHRGLTHLSPLVVTGLLGGFTTFSAFSLDIVTLWERGQGALAALYAGLSVAGAVAALLAGMWLTRAAVA